MKQVREHTKLQTPIKKMWDKFKEVNGNHKPITISPLENTITSPDEIADHYANILRDHIRKISQ